MAINKIKTLLRCISFAAAIVFILLIFKVTRIQKEISSFDPPKRDSPLNIDHTCPSCRPQTFSPTAVILFTQYRSGSSILGEIFNQRSDVSYFYEPLFPFRQLACDSVNQMRVEVLRQMTSCKFDELSDLYTKAFNLSKGDDFAGCVKRKICFAGGSQFLSRDAAMCRAGKACKDTPINTAALSQHCRQSLLVAMKVIYLCKLERLLSLFDDSNVKLKIVHLVRDPRATANSRARDGSSERYKQQAREVCKKLTINARFLEESQTQFDDNYLRIRHEDFCVDPVGTTRKIYDFVGINMVPGVENWLRETTSASNNNNLSVQNRQGTKRNARHVLSAWRKLRSFDAVMEVQKICSDAMKIFGYKLFQSKDQLTDIEGLSSF